MTKFLLPAARAMSPLGLSQIAEHAEPVLPEHGRLNEIPNRQKSLRKAFGEQF